MTNKKLTIVIGTMAVVALIMGLVGIFQTRKVPLQGERGIQGVKGDTGAQGLRGLQGAQGDRGATGASGSIGMPLQLGAASGYAHQQKESFLQGLAAGVRDQFSLTNAGVLSTSGAATFTGASTFTGTSTVTQSVDGLVVGGTISTAATGTARTIYTNSTGPKFCDSGISYVYAKNNGSFSPSMRISVGTSTASVTTTNLVASSTLATSTTKVIIPIDSSFVLDNGDSVMAIFDDNNNSAASSTYFSNWSVEAGVWCQDLSI